MAGSLIVWRTTSTSASPIIAHCFTIHFLKFQMVIPSASFLSSCINLERWSKMLFILSTYCWASSGFCAPVSGHSSSSSSSKSITGGTSSEAIFNHNVLDTKPKEGGNLVGTSKKRFRMVFFGGNSSLYSAHDFDPRATPWLIFYTDQSPSSTHQC